MTRVHFVTVIMKTMEHDEKREHIVSQGNCSHGNLVKSDTFFGFGTQIGHLLVGIKREAANVEDVRRVSDVATSDDHGEVGNTRTRRGEGERPRIRLLQLHFHFHPTAGRAFKKRH